MRARVVWGHIGPRKNLEKKSNLMRYDVYFDQILSLENYQ